MSDLNRRQFLTSALSNLLQVAGSVTLASAALARSRSGEAPAGAEPAAGAEGPTGAEPAAGRAAGNLQQQADELAAAIGPAPDAQVGEQAAADPQLAQFLNGGWRNGGPGGFRNGGPGGFRNRPWRNGPWRNG